MTLDDLQNGYFLYQSENGFRFGVDAVLLSDFLRCEPSDRILDMGTGNGIIPVLLAAKGKGAHITGLEIQTEQVGTALKSVAYNSLEEKISIVNGDIKKAPELFEYESFDVCVSNPPYIKAGGGKTAADPAKAIARHELLCTFDDICAAAWKLLKPTGRLFIVHRPERLAELIRTMSLHKLEVKRLQFVHPYADKPANLVLIEALKGGASGLVTEPPIIMYKK